MSQIRKNFIARNEGFVCQHCGFENPPSKGSCRNHCVKCLYSLHVDHEVPGDRLSTCKSLMKPLELDHHSKKGKMIIHQCLTCGKKMRNIVSPDDDMDMLIQLSLAHE